MTATFSNGPTTAEQTTYFGDSTGTLGELSQELSRALDQALWTFELQGELEDALDVAFLRSALAGTPTLSGGLISAAAA
jgi:hypothetical protein